MGGRVVSFWARSSRSRCRRRSRGEQIAGRPLWVVPNPGGRNAHAPLPTLVAAYREAAVAAGIRPFLQEGPTGAVQSPAPVSVPASGTASNSR